MMQRNNPLLVPVSLPDFAAFRPECVTPAVESVLAESRQKLKQLGALSEAPTWQNFVLPLEDVQERLAFVWGQVSHLNSVVNTPELRAAYHDNLPRIAAFYAAFLQDDQLYARFQALQQSAAFERLNPQQQRIVEHQLRDFRLGGVALPAEPRARVRVIQEELSELSARFSEHVLDETNDYACWVMDEQHLHGIPEDVIAVAREAAKADGKAGWKLTLHAPCYVPVMQYARHRPLREKMYYAYMTRASEYSALTERDNAGVIQRILQLRLELAQLLGYAHYAEMSLVSKMAQSVDEVVDFLRKLAHRVKPFAVQDMQDLRDYAAQHLDLPEVQVWDIAYVSEQLRVARYDYSDQEVKQYFPEHRVLAGLFGLVHTLYGLSVRQAVAPVWHESVLFYELVDETGQVTGQFYLDLYARSGKRSGAWMDEVISRRVKHAQIQIPVALLICNFPAPVGDKPALFTHDEVITLFHEFGHGLHHMLTRVEEYGVSGIKGVEWDAVELPSQLMENFCWEQEVLATLTQHVDSEEALPRALFEKMQAAKNFQSGMQAMRQIEFSLFDIRLHSQLNVDDRQLVEHLLAEVRAEVSVVFPPAWSRFANSFSHIFSGGYAAGYYSYKWAEVLSADVYSAFEEQGVLNRAVGERFWQEFLGQGGSRLALESFQAFRGRAPTLDAFLRHNGIVETC